MRVLLDATSAAREQRSGIGRYVFELVGALARLDPPPDVELGLRFSKRAGRRFLPSAAAGVRWLDDRLDRFLLRDRDVFHGPDARLTTSRRLPRVVTLHDMFSQQRADLAHADFRAKRQEQYRRIAAEADRILCVSEATRQAFGAEFPEALSRCDVVHHGISPSFRPPAAREVRAVREALGLPRPFLLFLGLLSTRKNLVVLQRAFDQYAARDPDLLLVLAGAPSHGHAEIVAERGRLQHAARIRELPFVADSQLPALYGAAEAFVFPSLAEGFGLPVLEAMACGTPVIASDLRVLHEVGGLHLLTADPTDVDAWEQAIQSVRDHPPAAERLAAQLRWAAEFRWDRCAKGTLAVYQRAIDSYSHAPSTPRGTSP